MAAGPYTTSDSLQYIPLQELLAVAAEDKPDVLVLCGPFLDANHADIKTNKFVDKTYEEAFFDRIVGKLNTFVRKDSPATRVILVPSERDVHHDFVFPAGPFELPRGEGDTPIYEKHGSISFARNPSTVRVNGVDFGIVSSDAMKFMNMCTVSNIASTKVRMRSWRRRHGLTRAVAGAWQAYGFAYRTDSVSALLHAMFSATERGTRFVPHAPAASVTIWLTNRAPQAAQFPLDVSRLAQARMTTTPHVLIAPSDLKFLAKPCLDGNVMLINPGRLTKGAGAGTFARIFVPTGDSVRKAPSNSAAQQTEPNPDGEKAGDNATTGQEDDGDMDKAPDAGGSEPTASDPVTGAASDMVVEIVRI